MPPAIAEMQAADWPAVREIYLQGIAGGQATFEVDAPPWQDWDAGHHHFARLVAREGNEIVGWAALSPVSKRRCYAGVAEASVYVAAAIRGHGVGRALLTALVEVSERQGIWTLQGATMADNVASLKLQESCGFRVVGRRERIARLHDEWRDTVLTERRSSVVG